MYNIYEIQNTIVWASAQGTELESQKLNTFFKCIDLKIYILFFEFSFRKNTFYLKKRSVRYPVQPMKLL